MKTAIVTGAGRGIGKSVSEHLLREGYKTVGISRTKKDLESLAGHALFLPFAGDLTDPAIRNEILEFCKSENIIPDVLVNNAGLYSRDTAVSLPSQLVDSLEINLTQVREFTALFWPRMVENKTAHIFNIISVLGVSIRSEAASYTISKHALSAYNKLLVQEGKKQGIKVTGIYPASVYTPAWEGTGVDPGKLISSDDIAKTILYALSLSQAAAPEAIHIGCMSEGY